MAIVKDIPSLPFSSGTEYEVFKYNYCNRCQKHKEREDGFPAFPEDGGCPIEDAMEFARFDRERFPGDKIRKLIDSDGDVAKWHHCMEFETWQVNKMSELKRCPFCGGKAEIVGSAYKRIICKGCETEIFITDETVDKWNTRKPMENIVERLEEELELTDKEKRRCVHENPLQFDEAKGYARGIANAIEIVKEEGDLHEI